MTCVGWEGTFRVCPHWGFKWDEIMEWAVNLMGEEPRVQRRSCGQCEARGASGEPGLREAVVRLETRNSTEEKPKEAGDDAPRTEPKKWGVKDPEACPTLWIRKAAGLPVQWPPDGQLDVNTLTKCLRDSSGLDSVNSALCPHVRVGDCLLSSAMIKAWRKAAEANPDSNDLESQLSKSKLMTDHRPRQPPRASSSRLTVD